jgi:hypothetical protein
MFWEALWRRVPTVGPAAATRRTYATPARQPRRMQWSGNRPNVTRSGVLAGDTDLGARGRGGAVGMATGYGRTT